MYQKRPLTLTTISRELVSDTIVSISSLAMVYSYLLCCNCVVRCIVARSVEGMVSISRELVSDTIQSLQTLSDRTLIPDTIPSTERATIS
jgi:hypothetical protein